jgi:hypothetical protein
MKTETVPMSLRKTSPADGTEREIGVMKPSNQQPSEDRILITLVSIDSQRYGYTTQIA